MYQHHDSPATASLQPTILSKMPYRRNFHRAAEVSLGPQWVKGWVRILTGQRTGEEK